MSGFPPPPPSSSSEADAKVAAAGPRTIELDEAKEIIAEMSAIVDDPANKEKIDGLKAQLQLVGTGVVQLASPVLEKHNLPKDPFGAMQAFQSMKPLMEDEEMAAAATKLKETFMTDELFEILNKLRAMSGAM